MAILMPQMIQAVLVGGSSNGSQLRKCKMGMSGRRSVVLNKPANLVIS